MPVKIRKTMLAMSETQVLLRKQGDFRFRLGSKMRLYVCSYLPGTAFVSSLQTVSVVCGRQTITSGSCFTG